MCQGEAPLVVRFARRHPRIAVIALASRWSQPVDVTRFAERYLQASPVKLVRDPNGAIAQSFGVRTHPHFVALDRAGRRIGDSVTFAAVLAQARYDAPRR